jgi:phosphoglucosamine mutase
MLPNNLVVPTVMANFGFFIAMKKLGIQTEVAAVGDRYVIEKMKDKGAVLGGEASGHLIFHNHHTTGDGIISALQLLAALRGAREPLSRLASIMTMTPQKMINVDVKRKPPIESIPEIQNAIRAAEAELRDQGRVLIRYSGTQSMCRVMVEGPTEEMTGRLTESLAATVRKCIG